MKKFLFWLAGALLLALCVAWLFRGELALRFAAAGAERAIAADTAAHLPDGLHLALCGAGSPMTDPRRSGPCVAVIAGGSMFVVDAGSGSARNLRQMNLQPGRISAVLLTHFHSDHIDGLGELALQRWVGSAAREPLPVYGPPGVEQVVLGFNIAYAQDDYYRNAHHGDAVAPVAGAGMLARPFGFDGVQTIRDADGLRILAFPVDHDPVRPAVGYRFEYRGRTLVLSGDTRKSEAVLEQARGADLLVHEALSPQLVQLLGDAAKRVGNRGIEKIMSDIPDYHTTPVQAAELAAEAGVPCLLLYHIVPGLPLKGLDKVFMDGVSAAFAGRTLLGRDGLLVSLPAHGREIVVDSIL